METDLVARRKRYIACLEEAVKKVCTLSALPEVKKISLFGSYARGRRDLFTDLDVLVVMETEEEFTARLKRVYSLLNLPVDCDVICYTPGEIKKLRAKGFLKKILKEEIVLYAQE